MGRQVLSLNRICLCSASLSKMWSLGPLLSEQRRQRSVNAVKLRSSGSVMAKHLMRRSRRQELSMCTSVWRRVGQRGIAGARREASGVAPPLRPGGHWRAPVSLRPPRHPVAPHLGPRPRPAQRTQPRRYRTLPCAVPKPPPFLDTEISESLYC